MDCSATAAADCSRASAICLAVNLMFAGSFRFPRRGCGLRYGQSVSTTIASSGNDAAASLSASFFGYVTGPAKEMRKPRSWYRCARSASPEKQWMAPIGWSRSPRLAHFV